MSIDSLDILSNTAIETLERFAFLLGDPLDAREAGLLPLPPCIWLCALTFSGARAGQIALAAAPDLARQIAVNLYSLEPDEITEIQAMDALKELLNIMTGNYLHALEGDAPIFDLSAPVLTTPDRADFARQWAGRPQAALNVEGRPLILGFGI